MTKLIEDILKQPGQLLQSMEYTLSEGWNEMENAAKLLRPAPVIYISGIGASWNAGLAVQAAFNESGLHTILYDASEFLHFVTPYKNSVVIFLSRSGRSVEIVNSLSKCRSAGACIISITNSPDSPLARGSDICLLTRVSFDRSISVNTYTSIVLTGQLLAGMLSPAFSRDDTYKALEPALAQVALKIHGWQDCICGSEWLRNNTYACFLARGSSLASAFESMLIWEEGAKQPASAMTTGAFRHGPQEIIHKEINIGLWIDNQVAREHDFRLLNDLQKYGIRTFTTGCNLPSGTKGLVIDIPYVPNSFQAVINIIPMQLAAEHLSKLKGEDCDSFRLCKSVVEYEGGL